MNFKLLNLGIFAISIIVFILFCEKYIHFTIDDAFIFISNSDNNSLLVVVDYEKEKNNTLPVKYYNNVINKIRFIGIFIQA